MGNVIYLVIGLIVSNKTLSESQMGSFLGFDELTLKLSCIFKQLGSARWLRKRQRILKY